jgi:hypothetical protein
VCCLHDETRTNKRHHRSPHVVHVVRGGTRRNLFIESSRNSTQKQTVILISGLATTLCSLLDNSNDTPFELPAVACSGPTQFLFAAITVNKYRTRKNTRHRSKMAPISSFTEPIMRAVRNLASAFLSRSIATTTTDPNSLSSQSAHEIKKRAPQILSIPATYALRDSSPEPGVVVGIVLGVVAAVVLVLFIIYQGLGLGGDSRGSISGGDSGVIVVEEEESVRGGPPRRGGLAARSRSSRGGRGRVMEEIVEVRRPHSRTHSLRETEDDYSEDVVEVIEESSATPYDEVEVEEEDESSVATSPPRRKRASGGGSYRRVDPLAYGDDGEPYQRSSRR